MDKHSSIPPFVERKSVHKTNKKALIILFLFFLIVLGVLFFQSSLSEIQSVSITGNEIVSNQEILASSNFEKGAFFFGVSESNAQKKIQAIPAIKEVTVRKHFPGKVSIDVQEKRIVSYFVDEESMIYPVLESGYVMPESLDTAIPYDASLLTGWENLKELEKVAEQLSKLDSVIMSDISEIHRNPSENYPKKVTVYTRKGYEIHVEYNQLTEKLKQYPILLEEVVERESGKGILYLLGDVSRFESYENALKEGDQHEESNEDESQDQ